MGAHPPAPSTTGWRRMALLLDTAKGANLKTTRKFDDFKLHIEFNCPEDRQ